MDKPNNIFEPINELYTNSNYFDRYGLDILITFILCIVFFLGITYYHILNNIEPIKADWTNQRCNPSVIPFAGIINKGPDETVFEYTHKNFTECNQILLKSITDNALKPFNSLLKMITSQFKTFLEAIQAIRGQFNIIRNNLTLVIEDIMNRAVNITIPIVELFIVIKSMIGKILGTITASIYTLLGSYFGMKSFMLFFISLIMKILYSLVGTITGLWIASIFAPMLIPTAIATTATMSAILIPTIVIRVMMSNVMELSTDSPPGVPPPACFAGNTLINLKDGKALEIKSLKIGSVLHDGSIVNGVMKLSAYKQDIYSICGIVVTGNHSIFHETMGWITVKDHPESSLVVNSEFKEPFVYCINTSTKTIKINNLTFSDWDDLDDKDFSELKQRSPLSKSKTFTTSDVHKVLGAGFHEESSIIMSNGDVKNISQVMVNDVLCGGQRVCGVVKLSGKDIISGVRNNIVLFHNTRSVKNKTLRSTGNIMVDDSVFGIKNTSDMEVDGEIIFPSYVYHLVTDTGSFVVNDVLVKDFNSSIENYLTSQ